MPVTTALGIDDFEIGDHFIIPGFIDSTSSTTTISSSGEVEHKTEFYCRDSLGNDFIATDNFCRSGVGYIEIARICQTDPKLNLFIKKTGEGAVLYLFPSYR
ncbi:MAG: hypothetical protein PHS07_03760 [Patescibacteria group bacterium]|nr:hypothetical protein [Patescibacteria group bacterium]